MKKLIIYDESCPMCRLYTKGLVAADGSGCLNRLSNNQLTDKLLLSRIDQQRARHEIPMIDLDGGETRYGVDTWTYALGQHNSLIDRVLSLKWLRRFLQKLYAFISYNRRIIITSAPSRWNLLDLEPDFRASYRLTFILVVFSLVGLLFYTLNPPVWIPAVMGLVIGQLSITCLHLLIFRAENFPQAMLDYGGHLGMSLLIGGVIYTVGVVSGWAPIVMGGYALIIGQHFIRVYRLGLTPWLSVCFTLLLFLLLPA